MYNRYQGNSGRVVRMKEEPPKKREEKLPSKPRPQPPPLRQLQGIAPISSLLPKGIPELETEDLILLLVLYLMYRKSGDSDLLIMMGAMFLL